MIRLWRMIMTESDKVCFGPMCVQLKFNLPNPACACTFAHAISNSLLNISSRYKRLVVDQITTRFKT